jgi:HSP20 family protein
MTALVKNFNTFPALFSDLLTDSAWPAAYYKNFPAANIKESDEGFGLELALAGYKKEDVKIEVQDRNLKVSSEISSETDVHTEKFYKKEFSTASFSRSFKLPLSVNSDEISARFENGVLYLYLPKKEEAKAKEPRLLEIA